MVYKEKGDVNPPPYPSSKQVTHSKLQRILESDDYQMVVIPSRGGYLSNSASSDEKGDGDIFYRKPYLSASYHIPYDTLKIAVLHNNFLYKIRKEGGNTYIDRMCADWWWYHDKVVLMSQLFWTHPTLKVFEFSNKVDKQEGDK